MKKILLSLTVILSFIFYSIHQKNEGIDQPNKVVAPSPRVNVVRRREFEDDEEHIPVNTPTNTPIPSSLSVQNNNGKYKNGEYIGDVTDAYYGNVQVKKLQEIL